MGCTQEVARPLANARELDENVELDRRCFPLVSIQIDNNHEKY